MPTATTNSRVLCPGDYSVVAIMPDGYIPGVDTAGSKGGIVVNPYAKIDSLLLSTLAVDPQGNAIVKIALNSGDAALHNNFSVVQIRNTARQAAWAAGIPQSAASDTRICRDRPLWPDPFRYGVSYVLPPIIMPQQLMGGSGGPPGYYLAFKRHQRRTTSAIAKRPIRRRWSNSTLQSRYLDRRRSESRRHLDHRRCQRRAGEKISLRPARRYARNRRLERRRRYQNRRVHRRPVVPGPQRQRHLG